VISQRFLEEPLSVAMHPCGLFLAVAFTTGFKVFALLSESLHTLKEINLTNCKIVRYAHGGQFLVANEKNVLILYDSIYYETLQVLEGHPSLIRDICISKNDAELVSTCMNGYVFC